METLTEGLASLSSSLPAVVVVAVLIVGLAAGGVTLLLRVLRGGEDEDEDELAMLPPPPELPDPLDPAGQMVSGARVIPPDEEEDGAPQAAMPPEQPAAATPPPSGNPQAAMPPEQPTAATPPPSGAPQAAMPPEQPAAATPPPSGNPQAAMPPEQPTAATPPPSGAPDGGTPGAGGGYGHWSDAVGDDRQSQPAWPRPAQPDRYRQPGANGYLEMDVNPIDGEDWPSDPDGLLHRLAAELDLDDRDNLRACLRAAQQVALQASERFHRADVFISEIRRRIDELDARPASPLHSDLLGLPRPADDPALLPAATFGDDEQEAHPATLPANPALFTAPQDTHEQQPGWAPEPAARDRQEQPKSRKAKREQAKDAREEARIARRAREMGVEVPDTPRSMSSDFLDTVDHTAYDLPEPLPPPLPANAGMPPGGGGT